MEIDAESGLPEPHLAVATADELRAWLTEHADQQDGLWLLTYKKSAGATRFVDRWDVLDELLCFGWIDGRRLKVPADEHGERTAQFISPRRHHKWTQTYRERFERLDANGRIAAPGRAAANMAKTEGSWAGMPEVDAFLVLDDLRVALDSRHASTWFDGAAPSYRRNILRYLATAKKPETKLKRIEMIADHAARGKKVPNY